MLKTLPILGKVFLKESTKEKPLLALELSEDKKVKVALWQIDEKPKILKKGTGKYEGDEDEGFSNIVQLIEKLVKEAGLKKGEVRGAIFGLPKDFIEEEKIKPLYQANLKKLCQQLSLNPLGFVETSAAIAFLLQEKENRLQSAILLKVTPSYFSFNVFKIGKEIGGKTVFYKENIALSLSQGLREFADVQTLPTKIVLYDGGENLEEIKQELLGYSWQKEAGFLHFPKIEILDEDFSLLALIAAGASESGKKISLLPKEEEMTSQELGFLKEEDVAEKEVRLTELEEEEKTSEEKKAVKEKIKEEQGIGVEEEISESKSNFFISLTQMVNSFFKDLPLRPNLKRIAILLSVLGLIMGGLLFYLYWIFPQARVMLFVEPYSLEKDAEVVLDLSPSGPEENLSRLPGKRLTTEKSGSDKIAVTSKKEVGDPARGEVTIYNKTTNVKSFSKGTTLLGPKGLKFTLDKDVTVASFSDVIAGTPGKEKVKVTAVVIGPEGNLGAGSDFTFEDFPVTSYAARNDESFSGGTSREITVVGKKDQEELFSLLEEKLTNEAKEGLEEKLGSSEKLLTQSIEGKILEKKFSHDVGEETDQLTLDLAMSFEGVSFSEDDLGTLLSKMVQESAPPGYKFDKEKVEMEVTSIEKEKDQILFNAHFKVKLTPEVKKEEIKEKVVGKEAKEVEMYLRMLPNVSGFELKFLSCPPFMAKRLPFNSQKISIEIHTL